MTGRCQYEFRIYWPGFVNEVTCSLQEGHLGPHVSMEIGAAALIWHDEKCLAEHDSFGRCQLKRDHASNHWALDKNTVAVTWE